MPLRDLTPHAPATTNALGGVSWALFGTFLFTIVFASGKLVGGDVPALQIIFVRYVVGIVVVVAVSTTGPTGLRAHRSPRPLVHLGRAACGAFGGMCAIQAAMLIPVADATALGLADGVLIVLLAVALLGERLSALGWTAAGLCLVGSLVVVLGGADGAGQTVGIDLKGYAFVRRCRPDRDREHPHQDLIGTRDLTRRALARQHFRHPHPSRSGPHRMAPARRRRIRRRRAGSYRHRGPVRLDHGLSRHRRRDRHADRLRLGDLRRSECWDTSCSTRPQRCQPCWARP